MRKKYTSLFLVILMAAFLLSMAGCAAPDATAEDNQAAAEAASAVPPSALPIELTDAMGRTLKLETLPRRIVSLSPSVTESLFAIGANDLLVARDDYSVNPAGGPGAPRASPSHRAASRWRRCWDSSRTW